MIIKSIALFLLIISLFFNLAHALSIEEKIDIIFNKLESTYGEYLTISDLTTSSDDNYYYRSYPSVVELIRIEKHSSEIWYFIEGEWKYFSTLDDANTFLCDGGCYEILSESRSPSPDPIDSPIEGESFLPIDNINRNIGEAFVPSQLDGGTDSSRERTFSGIKSIHGNYYPLSAIVKIFFKDRKGKATVCSGSMVEKDIVLTAGHCVHSDGAWMDQRTFTIIPAYDASVFNSEPFGRAGAVNLRALKGWIKNEDYKYDVGIIFLDKNIGNKTGWFGVKPHDRSSCKSEGITDYTYYNLGYPTRYKDGRVMQYWYGGIDSNYCKNYSGLWSIKNPPTHTFLGGYSGSPLIYNYGNQKGWNVEAVFSHETDQSKGCWVEGPWYNQTEMCDHRTRYIKASYTVLYRHMKNTIFK